MQTKYRQAGYVTLSALRAALRRALAALRLAPLADLERANAHILAHLATIGRQGDEIRVQGRIIKRLEDDVERLDTLLMPKFRPDFWRPGVTPLSTEGGCYVIRLMPNTHAVSVALPQDARHYNPKDVSRWAQRWASDVARDMVQDLAAMYEAAFKHARR